MSTGSSRPSGVVIAAVITGLATIIAAVIALNAGGGSGGLDEGGNGVSLDGGGGVQEPDYSDRVGIYTGEAVNKTTGSTTAASLDLRSIDRNSGNIDAYLDLNTNSDIGGRGNLSGTIDEDAAMNLAGDVYAGEYIWDANLDCQFTDPEAIECTFTLDSRPGNPSGSHEGTLSLTLG